MRKLNIGLTEEQRAGVVELLNRDVADAYLLLIKTKKFHWDVVGPQFRSLHQIWEEQYQALTTSIDSMAERVRTLGGFPVGTAGGFLKNASVKEQEDNIPLATEMVAQLVDDHELIIRNLRDHECVLVHCERGYRRVTLPPLESDGMVAKWFSRWKRLI